MLIEILFSSNYIQNDIILSNLNAEQDRFHKTGYLSTESLSPNAVFLLNATYAEGDVCLCVYIQG